MGSRSLWFCVGCALAGMTVLSVRVAVQHKRDAAQVQSSEVPASASFVEVQVPSKMSTVPIQRPTHLRRAGVTGVSNVYRDDYRYDPNQARLVIGPNTAFDPENARLPSGLIASVAQWTPNNAVLPKKAEALRWNPNSARLP